MIEQTIKYVNLYGDDVVGDVELFKRNNYKPVKRKVI